MSPKDARRGSTQVPIIKHKQELALEEKIIVFEAKLAAFELRPRAGKNTRMVQATVSYSVWLESRAASREKTAERAGASPKVLKEKAHSSHGEGRWEQKEADWRFLRLVARPVESL